MHNILCAARHVDDVDLKAQAVLVFSALGVARFEERFSSNYPPDDHYLLGFGVNASVEVCDVDEEGPTDFPYWVTLRSPVSWGEPVDTLPTDLTVIASLLQQAGIQSKSWVD
jgi:hypothetical protein